MGQGGATDRVGYGGATNGDHGGSLGPKGPVMRSRRWEAGTTALAINVTRGLQSQSVRCFMSKKSIEASVGVSECRIFLGFEIEATLIWRNIR